MAAQDSNNYLAKLTKDKASQIRNLHSRGYTMTKLAEDYGVCVATISKVVHKKTWRHTTLAPQTTEFCETCGQLPRSV